MRNSSRLDNSPRKSRAKNSMFHSCTSPRPHLLTLLRQRNAAANDATERNRKKPHVPRAALLPLQKTHRRSAFARGVDVGDHHVIGFRDGCISSFSIQCSCSDNQAPVRVLRPNSFDRLANFCRMMGVIVVNRNAVAFSGELKAANATFRLPHTFNRGIAVDAYRLRQGNCPSQSHCDLCAPMIVMSPLRSSSADRSRTLGQLQFGGLLCARIQSRNKSIGGCRSLARRTERHRYADLHAPW